MQNDPVIAEPGAAQTTPEGVTPTAGDGGQSKQSSDDVAEIVATKVAEQMAALRNSLFAEVRRISKPAQATTQPASQTKESEADVTIAERLRVLEEERQQVAADRRENAILSSLTSAGVPSDRQEAALDHIERRYGSLIQFDREARKVVYREFDGDTPKDVTSFVKDFLKLPNGQIFLPAPSTGQLPHGRHTGTSKPPFHQLDLDSRLKMTGQERIAYIKANG